MPRRIETLFIPGPAGRIEALLEEPEDREPEQAALVCHPHPLHGGTMHNKVVHRMARGLRHSGHAVLRFNFRGVNLSEGTHDGGVGEVEDAEAALRLLRERYPALPYSIAGFSFGSRVALRLAQRHADARRVIAVGFPALFPGLEALRECPVPRVFVHSTRDSICAPEPAHQFYESIEGRKQFLWVEAADHFFANALPQFEETIRALE
ncbi:MAG: alpha/beta fold hydrolase [Bryobacterales bacterium]|nr:alpha/beta fold hydrolase [Bryobacterales bacterium]